MGIVTVVYWTWLLVAALVLIYRVYGRATGKRSSIFDFQGRSSEPPVDPASTAELAPPVPAAAQRSAAQVAVGSEASPGDDLGAGEIHPSVLAALRSDEPTAPEAARPASGGGLFSAETRQAHQDAAAGTLAPLRETLTGIEMPCDLVPVTDLGPRPARELARERLVLMTASAGAGEVAARLADELERIGLDVASTGPASCVARRHDRAVEVRVHEFPDRLEVDGSQCFPTAPDGSVVVELLAA